MVQLLAAGRPLYLSRPAEGCNGIAYSDMNYFKVENRNMKHKSIQNVLDTPWE